jgi:hypothetical protein
MRSEGFGRVGICPWRAFGALSGRIEPVLRAPATFTPSEEFMIRISDRRIGFARMPRALWERLFDALDGRSRERSAAAADRQPGRLA